MKISGLQKLSMVDYDGHISATIFLAGCNFSCPFCHNSSLVMGNDPEIKESEIIEYLIKRKNVIDSVVISGGEPTLHSDLPKFISKIKELGYLIKLDTNGTNLEMLKYLVEQKLIDYIAMDIKNSLRSYSKTSGRSVDTDQIEKTLKYIMHSGIPYEFRTTIVREFHTEEDMISIGKLIKGANKYFLQRFKDSGSCIENNLNDIDKETAEKYLSIVQKYIPSAKLRGY